MRIALFLFLAASSVFAQFGVNSPFYTAAIIKAQAAGGGPTYLVEENFEGAGTPASWTTTGTQQSANFDDTTPAAAQGSESVFLFADTSADTTMVTPTFAATTDLHFFFRLYVTALPLTGRNLVQLRSTTTVRETFLLASTGALQITGGSATVGVLSTATWYYIWGGYNASTGDSYFTFSTDGIKPSSGNDYTTAAQAGTADVDNIRIQSDFSATAGPDINVDRVLVDDASIGDDP